MALGTWAAIAFALGPAESLPFALPVLVFAVVLAAVSAWRAIPYTDVGALLLVAGSFLGAGIFLAPVGLEELYAFVGVGIFTVQVTRFRSMVRPFLEGADRASHDALRSLYGTFLQRLGFLVVLVVVVSLMLSVAASASLFVLTTELTAFLLGLAILLAFLAIARLGSRD